MWIESTAGRIGAAGNADQFPPCGNRTRFPAGTTARIFRRGRSAMSSGQADTHCWRLTFHGQGRRFIEPVMGWTGTSDPLSGLELKFPTLDAAVRYARRQGLPFVVEGMALPTLRPATDDAAGSVVVLKQAA